MEPLLVVAVVSVLGILIFPSCSSGEGKYYTKNRMGIIRGNLEKYPWARAQCEEIITTAEKWAKYDDEKLRTLVVPPQVPRGYQVHNDGCPVHGIKVHEKGLYRWIIDFDNPYKVTCPVGGEEYPSNDFGAFLESGMQDRSLLTGPYADDGWGWHRPEDKEPANYWFVGYYTHWSMMRFLMEAIENLGKAAVLSEDHQNAQRYAHKAALLLWQLAEYYPDYAYDKQSRETKEHNPNYTGKLFNMIWATRPPVVCAIAYDAVRPFLAEDTQLQALAGKSSHDIDDVIREGLLREAATCTLDGSGRIRGNYGMHQKTLLTLSQVLDDSSRSPTSQEMIDYVISNPNLIRDTDMGLRDAIENLVYRDGMPHESIGYNGIWVNDLTELAELLVEQGINIFELPRYKKLVAWAFDVCIAGKFTPSTGDTGNMFASGGVWQPGVCQVALPYVDDPRLAWALRSGSGARQDLFSLPADDLIASIPDEEYPEVGLQSYHFPAYGMANLQAGEDVNRSAVSFFYGDHQAHKHYDQLNILLFSHDNVLLTDIGYPEQTDPFNHRLYGFFTNTVAHNTVVVDAERQVRGPGRLHALSMKGFAQVVDASCEGAYPDRVSLYRRANMLVEATPEQHYLFDIFHVQGGSQHDYMVHGNQAEFTCAPELGPIRSGSFAGEDVPYEQFYDDENLKDKRLSSVPYTGYRGSGFQFLYNVQRRALEGEAIADWRLTEPMDGQPERPWEGLGVRAHMVGDGETLYACDGPVQKYEFLPESVKFLARRRQGKDLASSYLTIYEPYSGSTWIDRVRQLGVDPVDGKANAVQVDLTNGETHYIFHSLDYESTYKLENGVVVSGEMACMVLDPGGGVKRAMLLNGSELRLGDWSLQGGGQRTSKISAIDYENGVIQLQDPVLRDGPGAGQAMPLISDGFTDSVTLQKVLDDHTFSIGDEDLKVAGGPVLSVDGDTLLTSASNPHAHVGMTVLNSRNTSIGKLKEKIEGGWRIDRDGLSMDDFPTVEGDPGPRYSVVMAGPGDEILNPSVVTFEGTN
jgi:hypothetical protein